LRVMTLMRAFALEVPLESSTTFQNPLLTLPYIYSSNLHLFDRIGFGSASE